MAMLAARVATAVTAVALGAFSLSGLMMISTVALKGKSLHSQTEKSLGDLKDDMSKKLAVITAKKAEALLQGQSRLAADYIANFNLPQLDELAKTLMSDPDIAFVEFTSADGKQLSSAGENKGGYEIIAAPINSASNKLGEMKVALNHSSQKKLTESFETASAQARERISSAIDGMRSALVGTMLLSALIAAAALSAVVVLVLKRLVLEPINAFDRLVGSLAQGKIDTNNSTLKTIAARPDEVGKIAQSVEKLSHYLDAQANLAEKVAQGDLSVSVNLASEEDRFGLAYHQMIIMFRNAIEQINESAKVVDNAGNNIDKEVESLTDNAMRGAAAAEEISSSVNDVSQRLEDIISKLAISAQSSNKMMDASNTGHSQITTISETMKSIVEASQHIQNVVKTIDEIAFQTNLLALNAAVEAARAGAHGKGFAVVAEEVRALSGRSAKAAQEAANIVSEAEKRAQNGEAMVAHGLTTFANIASQSTTLASDLQILSDASREQVTRVAQVSQGMEQVSQMTQITTIAAERLSASSAELTTRSRTLKEVLQHFRSHR
jgi:methyl-accepting chemotaxis protein